MNKTKNRSLVKAKGVNKVDTQTGLSLRQRNLLFAVVKEYCEFGNSVSSQELKEKYDLDISSATIRNEFIQLRDMGYLYQPFTNSSSQPTEIAFKLFVNQLLTGLQVTSRQQQDLRRQIVELETKHSNLQREISRLLAFETNSVGFAVDVSNESISGIKNLLGEPNTQQVSDILDFLENLDQHKKLLLENKQDKKRDLAHKNSNNISTIFGGEGGVFPLGRGYAIGATHVMVNNQETVIGIITQPHILGRKKTLQVINALARALEDENDENNANSNKK
jgi:transcriptional regulator of heat shock response